MATLRKDDTHTTHFHGSRKQASFLPLRSFLGAWESSVAFGRKGVCVCRNSVVPLLRTPPLPVDPAVAAMASMEIAACTHVGWEVAWMGLHHSLLGGSPTISPTWVVFVQL